MLENASGRCIQEDVNNPVGAHRVFLQKLHFTSSIKPFVLNVALGFDSQATHRLLHLLWRGRTQTLFRDQQK